MHVLWSALAQYIAAHEIEVLFGVASFHGTDVGAVSQPLALLHHRHLAPPELRVRAQTYQTMNLCAAGDLDRKVATRAIPSLIKAYLRLGGVVGDGTFIDHAFNTIDVCLLLDIARMNDRQRRIYAGGSA